MSGSRILPDNPRGILFMLAGILSFVINDTFLKMSTETLPPFQALFLRGIFAVLLALPLILVIGARRQLPLVFDRQVVMRNVTELVTVLGFIVGLAHVSIAEITVLSQLAPILLMIGAAVFMRARVTWWQLGLAGAAFVGALLVAQPGGEVFSIYMLFGLWNAVGVAIRDLVGSKVGAHVPGMIVALGASMTVALGSGVAMLITGEMAGFGLREIGILALAALFLNGGQFGIFMAYRYGEPGIVAPFFYSSTIWAVLSAVVVFGEVPNLLSFTGIALIAISGLTLVVLGERLRRPAAASRG